MADKEPITLDEFEDMASTMLALLLVDMREQGTPQSHTIEKVAIKTASGLVTIEGITLTVSPPAKGKKDGK